MTLDGCYVDEQPWLDRFIPRGIEGKTCGRRPVTALVSQVFFTAVDHFRHDLLRVTYTHSVLECERT